MKSKILMSLTIVICSLSHTAFAESRAKVFKTLDGAVVRCGLESSVENKFGAKNVLVELVDEVASQKSHGASLKVSLVKCESNKWVLDQDPAYEKYVAPNGETVEVQYFDYNLLILDKDSKVIAIESLENLKSAGEEKVFAMISKNNDDPQDLEVIVTAKKSVKSSGGFAFEAMESFGSFRLRITK